MRDKVAYIRDIRWNCGVSKPLFHLPFQTIDLLEDVDTNDDVSVDARSFYDGSIHALVRISTSCQSLAFHPFSSSIFCSISFHSLLFFTRRQKQKLAQFNDLAVIS